ncbi:MAG: indole-3-glycerol phosphate synthase TrpC [Clostridiales bacterium]|jgi:indole-3-glycerol phosphate synthase|nr:indole-3-glycerol phosphate synthase TrpC [Clostridiales bacterium]
MILDKIIESTARCVDIQKRSRPYCSVRREAEARQKPPASFEDALSKRGMSFICEVKRASPSKGVICADFPYVKIAEEYRDAGADAVSVLTEPEFFEGKDEYLAEISAAISLPALRKDFVIDEYQIFEARLLGASAVLLICAVLDGAALSEYISAARSLKMSALVEARDERQIEKALKAGAKIIGVNNRDLTTFKVDTAVSVALRRLVPKDILFVSESGVETRSDIEILEQNAVDGVLIGETMMRAKDKTQALKALRGV